ncbi:MAG TPA: Hpt domain-containing protein, partial [Desulfomicrobiaceae bacterium]|nr:Hpt domain-containing protein [Desulfomicrobiaceae bacterium]
MMISENARTLFVEESREHLQDIETVLLAMEQSGAEESGGYVDQAFRAAHSIKGGAGFLGYKR